MLDVASPTPAMWVGESKFDFGMLCVHGLVVTDAGGFAQSSILLGDGCIILIFVSAHIAGYISLVGAYFSARKLLIKL